MKRLILLAGLFTLLLSLPVPGEELPHLLIDEYRASRESVRESEEISALPYRSGVSLTLEEEYRSPGSGAPGTAGSTPSFWNPVSLMLTPHPLGYAVGSFILLLLLFLATDLYLRFRIAASLHRIPWEGIRTDPDVTRWPSKNLFAKLRLWRYLQDLPLVKKIFLTRERQPLLKRNLDDDRNLTRKYLRLLPQTQESSETRLILGVLSVTGDQEIVGPVVSLLNQYPEHPQVREDVASTLLSLTDTETLRSILPLLSQGGPALMDIALQLCRSHGDQAESLLLEELEHRKEPGVKIGIFELLGEVGNENTVPAMEPYLFRGSNKEKIAAILAIGKIGSETAIEPLLHGLCQSPSPSVRNCIVQSLLQAPGDTAEAKLTQILETSPTYYFRVRAIEALEVFRPDSCPALDAALRDSHPKVRATAAAALERMGVVEKRLRTYWEEFDEGALEFLIRVGKAGVLDPFVSSLKNDESKAVKRTVRLLARIGNQTVIPKLRELLASTEDWTIKSRTIQALGTLKANDAIPDIVDQLNSRYHWVRKTAMDALGKLLSPDSRQRKQTLPTLREALKDESPWTRASAIHVLTLLEDRSCIPLFIELLRDQQTRVRFEAIRGLKWFHAMEAQADLIDMLDDPRQKVCAMAASAFGQFKSRRALPKLFERFETATPLLRLAILEAVYHIDPMELDPLLRYLKTENWANLKVVRQLKDIISFDASRILIPLANTGETPIRCQALRSLSVIEGTDNEAFFLSLLKDADPDIRAAAVDAIALGENQDLGETLNDMLNDPDHKVRLRVILALGLVKNPGTLPFLRNAVHDEDPETQAHALLTLFHYAEPSFPELFLTQFKEMTVRNRLKKIISNRKDDVAALLVERVPPFRKAELQILQNHTLTSLDIRLEEELLFGTTKEEKLRAIMVIEILKRKKLKRALKKAIQGDPQAEIRARALRAYSSLTDIAHEQDLIQKAIQDPALEVQTMASRLLIHLEEEPA